MPSEKGSGKTEVDMRHTKISAKDAALLAGELKKPSWQSKNEGIHERVSFEDSIWGFDLAGGSYYKTPLRVTRVKADSRAEKAGIRPGDMLLRINDIDTSTLTIQEAHEIIIESGIYLRIAVTAPDDEEDSYFCWQDELESGYDSEEERRKEKEKQKKREIHAKVSSYWSLQWPWVSKRRVIYRESNCFMVPSKFESKHRDKFPIQPVGPKVPDDIVLHSKNAENEGTLTTITPLESNTNTADTVQNNLPEQKEAPKSDSTEETKENASESIVNNGKVEDLNSVENSVTPADNETHEVNVEEATAENKESSIADDVSNSDTLENTEEIVDSDDKMELGDDKDAVVENEVNANGVESDNKMELVENNDNPEENMSDDAVINELVQNGVNGNNDEDIINEILEKSNTELEENGVI